MSTPVISSDILSSMTSGKIIVLAAGLLFLKIMHELPRPVNNWISPLRHLPGPKINSWIFGHIIEVLEDQEHATLGGWAEQYGKTFKFRRFFGGHQLCTLDMRAVNFIMTNSAVFPKPEALRADLAAILGKGLFSADEVTHKRQRRIMNPAFGGGNIRNLAPIFWEKANQLRDAWIEVLDDNLEGVEIETFSWLSRATLDVIGLAGFGYDFGSIEGKDIDELAEAFNRVFAANSKFSKLLVLKNIVCDMVGLPTEAGRRLQRNLAIIRKISKGIVHDKKMLLQEGNDKEPRDRDLLTLLIASNIAPQRNKIQALSDEEVMGQISTFLAAGQDSVGSSTAWALYVLAKHHEVQVQLRCEVQNSGLGPKPSVEELEKLGYLHNVVREVLRLYAVVPMTAREALHDGVIPVQEPFTDARGVVCSEIRVKKGDSICIPILAMNRAKDIWGEDAMVFRPNRWNELPSAVKEMPGAWSHLMTFIHGPHACIGYQFAVIEMKVLLYTLVRSFEFGIDPTINIVKNTWMVTRPRVESDPEGYHRMPLICKPATQAHD